MKIHQQAFDALESINLKLRERKRCTWTGSLTAWIEYSAVSENGQVFASAGFHHNRHPATYRHQGITARLGTQRFAALDSIAKQLGVQR